MYNLYNTEAQFKEMLIAGNISPVSVRNYLSDFRFFYGWFTNIYKAGSLARDLTDASLQSYRDYLIASKLPCTSINRRLSTVRKLCEFLRKMSVIETYPEKGLTTYVPSQAQQEHINSEHKKILAEFKYDLLLNNFSSGEVERYITHVDSFVADIMVK